MYNYNKSDLERIASGTDFIRDNLEKVFRLCDVLRHLNENPLFSEHLALKGGTAINLTIFNFPRLSVDIDLDFTTACSREKMLAIRENINQDFLNYMFTQGYALSPNIKNPRSLDSWVFYFQNAGGNKDNLKVEINYSLRNHILPIVRKKAGVEFLRLDYEVRTLSTLEFPFVFFHLAIIFFVSLIRYDFPWLWKASHNYGDSLREAKENIIDYIRT